MPLNNGLFITRLSFIDLDSIELSQYPFMISLEKCYKSYSTLDDSSATICVPNKTDDVNVSVSNMIIEIAEAKRLLLQ